jgi:gliding motility-associated-like protein
LLTPPPPTITSFSPATGPVGTIVNIIGTNMDPLAANNIVTFNGTPATVASSTTTSIQTAVPAGASTGPISVTIGTDVVTSTTDFVVACDPPCTPTLLIYNAISPNGDGANELLLLENITSLPELTENTVTIFNRWGDIIFEVANYDNTTNAFRGISKSGAELPTGTYYYSIEFKSGASKRTGFISLKR